MTPEDEMVALHAENAQQRQHLVLVLAQNAALLERVRELEARLAKDSHNRSKPPSSDGRARTPSKTKRLRRRSGKKPGGQVGHRGETLHLVPTPDDVVEHRPAICVGCQASLDVDASDVDASVVLRERRQVQELPPVRLRVTEQPALHVRCPTCQTVRVGAFPSEASSRAPDGPHLRAVVV